LFLVAKIKLVLFLAQYAELFWPYWATFLTCWNQLTFG